MALLQKMVNRNAEIYRNESRQKVVIEVRTRTTGPGASLMKTHLSGSDRHDLLPSEGFESEKLTFEQQEGISIRSWGGSVTYEISTPGSEFGPSRYTARRTVVKASNGRMLTTVQAESLYGDSILRAVKDDGISDVELLQDAPIAISFLLEVGESIEVIPGDGSIVELCRIDYQSE